MEGDLHTGAVVSAGGCDPQGVQQRCIRDLLGLLALPALWSGQDARGVIELMFGSLEALLPLDLTYAVHDTDQPGDPGLEVLRLGQADAADRLEALRPHLLVAQRSGDPLEVPPLPPLRTTSAPIGFLGQGGFMLFGSRAPDFPSTLQLVLIRAAVSLVTGGLQAARLMRESQAASQAKDEFLAMLGHELRNPLSPIVTALQLLKLRAAATTPEIEVIERQVSRLVTLVDDMMDISRITRGKVELKKEPLELATVVAGAVEAAGPLIKQRSHSITIDLDGQGLLVDADPMRLTQVITNLLTNAAKYTEPGGHLQVRGRRAGPEGAVELPAAEIVLSVIDDGVGISSDQLSRIFDLFVQAGPTIHRREGGLGLGLALVRNLIQLHGGSVTAHSAGPGKGSEFRLRLPASHSPPRPPAGLPGLLAESLTRAERVLVVDDNADAADLLAEILREVGHHVEVTHDGTAALRHMHLMRPSVAILDIGLPGMDGYELAAKIREELGSEAPRLIALTGYGQEQDRRRSARAGFCAHLVKPVNLPEVLAAVADERDGPTLS